MADKPNPTRMELINAKRRIKLAEKGHSLLKKKRDALIIEFFKVMKRSKDLRSQLNSILREAYQDMLIAELVYDKARIESMIYASESYSGISSETKNIMGLKVPKVIIEKQRSGIDLSLPSPLLMRVRRRFLEALEMIITIAETETAIKRLIREIEKTKRRVNALEFVLIPKLKEEARNIQFRLEEMERDTFIMLKTLKRSRSKNT